MFQLRQRRWPATQHIGVGPIGRGDEGVMRDQDRELLAGSASSAVGLGKLPGSHPAAGEREGSGGIRTPRM